MLREGVLYSLARGPVAIYGTSVSPSCHREIAGGPYANDLTKNELRLGATEPRTAKCPPILTPERFLITFENYDCGSLGPY